ncbi:tail fiber domain-containing protein [Aquirufa antheringensis]
MKKLLTFLSLIVSISAFCQDNGINFQGVGRNSSGAVLATQKISLRFSVIQGSETGSVEYVESKEVTTNAQGIFSVVIGDGTQISKTGNFTDINWKINPKFLKVEMDPAGGTSFAAMGTTRLQSVPFAYYANGVNADNVDGVLSASKGGTGVASISALKTALGVDQIYTTTEKNKLAAVSGTNTGDQDLSGLATISQLSGKANTIDLALKAPLESPTFSGTVTGITKAMVGLSNVDNTADLAKPISSATQAALDLKASTTTLALKENVANKSTSSDLGGINPSDILYPTQKAVKDYITANTASGGIADGGVTSIKIANGAVTNEKISNSAVALLSGTNTGDETEASIKSKLGVSRFFSGNFNDLTNRPVIPVLGDFSFENNILRGNANQVDISTDENSDGIYLFPFGSDGYGSDVGKIDIENSGVKIWSKYNINNGIKWDFAPNGNLTLPTGGDILDVNGNSVLNPENAFFSITPNSILTKTNPLTQNQNTNPLIIGNDNAKLKIKAWSENDSHTTISNALPESTITTYSSGNGSTRMLWEDLADVNKYSRIQLSENGINLTLEDPSNYEYSNWEFTRYGELVLPENGTIILNDGNNYIPLSSILPLTSYNEGYVLTEDGNGNANWQDKSTFNYLTVNSDGNEPGIFLHQNDPWAPTWLRVGNDGGGAEYGVVGDDNQFFDGTVQGDIALKAFSSLNDKKMFIGATFGGQANLVLSPDGTIQANGVLNVPEMTIGYTPSSSSAALAINSTTKGFLPPRMAESDKNNIDSPEDGLIIWCYDCGTSGSGELQVFRGNSWTSLSGGSGQNTSYTAGNGLTLTGTTFSIGTGAITSTAIADGSITDNDINSTAAINYSKLNLTGSIVSSDISSSAAINYSKLNLSNSIVSNDLTSASITSSKLADASVTNAKISGPISVANGGTGTSTLTQNTILVGNGSGALQFIAPGASGNILKSNGTTWVSDVAASGATSLDNLSDVRSQGFGFSNSLLIGHKDLPNLLRSDGTTAIGIGVLQNLNNGSYNTAIGHNSMKLIHQGWENVALGAFSLYSVYSGKNNTGLGNSALYYNTNDNNVAVGYNTMYSNTLGSNNSAIGALALYSNTTGIRNTANGLSSLYSSNGDYNTASGFYSMTMNTSGSYNSAFGSEALGGNTTGFYNTAIGYEAGRYIYTGSNNTAIGYNAQASNNSVSNQITLGNGSITSLRAMVTSITALSDRRDKTEIIDIAEGIDFIKQLKPVTFTWNTRDKAKVGIKAAGFIAQDLLALQKSSEIGDNLDLVSEDNPDKLEARYNNLLPVMVKAIQDQQTIIEQLKKELVELRQLIQNK